MCTVHATWIRTPLARRARPTPFASPPLVLMLTAFPAAASVLFGFMAGTCCNFATQLKYIFGYDDTLDVRLFPSSSLVLFSLHSLRSHSLPCTTSPLSPHFRFVTTPTQSQASTLCIHSTSPWTHRTWPLSVSRRACLAAVTVIPVAGVPRGCASVRHAGVYSSQIRLPTTRTVRSVARARRPALSSSALSFLRSSLDLPDHIC